MSEKIQKFQIIYSFDQAIANNHERLASAYDQLFNKIDEMERNGEIKEKMQKGDKYGKHFNNP